MQVDWEQKLDAEWEQRRQAIWDKRYLREPLPAMVRPKRRINWPMVAIAIMCVVFWAFALYGAWKWVNG